MSHDYQYLVPGAELDRVLAERDAALHQRDNFERIARERAEDHHRSWKRANELEAEVERLRRIEKAAQALHEEVEMAESVGICLPDRLPSLRLGDALVGGDSE